MTNITAATENQGQTIAEVPQSIEGVYGLYELAKLRRSPDNRKRFNEQNLQELAASIKSMGVAQPILIRPVTPTAEEPEEFEIVAGERRYRASKIAGMTTIPAMCRHLSDLDAAKIRILENLQREDPHEMEEAEGYQLLMMQHGYSADQLADEIKKSRAYIYARLKLCALTPEVREQFLDGKIPASTALLIARIPVPALQVKALDEILNPPVWQGSEPLSYRKAAEHVQARYMLDLSTAIFKLNDSKLLAAAGSCVKCPKRTGNQPELFAGISADVCTDPDCFAEKKAAHLTATITMANKKGIPVYEGDEAIALRQTMYSSSSEFTHAGVHITYFARNAPSTKNLGSVGQYLKPEALDAIEVAGYLKATSGDLTPLFRREAMQDALEAAGACETTEQHQARMREIEADPSKAPPKSAYQLQQERQQQERRDAEIVAEKERTYRLSLYKKLRQHAIVAGLSLPSLREYAKAMVDEFPLAESVQGLYEVDLHTDSDAFIDAADSGTLQLLLIDVMLGRMLEVSWWEIKNGSADEDDFQTIVAMARHEGIDVDAVRAEASPAPAPADQPAAPAAELAPEAAQVDATIDLAPMQQHDLVDFIARHPQRLDELTQLVLVHPRGELTSMLEAAAAEHGYTWSGQRFVLQAEKQVESPADTAAVETGPAAAPIEAPKAKAKGKAKPAPAAKAKAAPPKPEPKKKTKSSVSTGQPAKTAPDAEQDPWPFPKSSTAPRDAVTPAAQADEVPA
ncbi:ParB/RepB/Spo0J family partition protein [Telluria sp. B2]